MDLIEELKKDRERNRKERLKFIERYVKWLKKTPNRIWSKQQSEFLDNQLIQNKDYKSKRYTCDNH